VNRCALGFDADDVANALHGEALRGGRALTAEHLATCASCRGERRLFEGVHATWRDAQGEDDRSRAVFREQRLVHGVRPRRAYVAWRGYAALAGAVLVIVVAPSWRLISPAPAPEERAPAVARELALPPSPPSSPPRPEVGVAVLAVAGAVSPPVGVGDRLPKSVHLAAGASLTLAWSFALDDKAVIVGPADLSLVGEGSSIALVLRRANAETGAIEERRVEVGASLLPPAKREKGAPSTSPPHEAVDPAKEFARGMASLSAGDRRRAQRSFRLVADSRDTPASLRHRAVFRWAELELARGESDRARAELATLLTSANLALAADAAFLLARSASAPAERADVWGRYLTRHPGTPYREDAMLERAGALIAAGGSEDAADLLAELSTEATLTKVQQVRLQSLQNQLR
jgi:hypothetical protein